MGDGSTDRDRAADEREAVLAAREAALAEREAALSVRERALAERMGAAHDILVAAEERDAVSDARDVGGDTREQILDRAHFLATDHTYGDELPMRRGAALDRDHARGDRTASRDDRIALTESPHEPEADETTQDQP
jgi:hypothetical protein